MNIFDSVRHYDNAWVIAKEEKFSEEELQIIESVTVVNGDYGLSCKVVTPSFCCFFSLSTKQDFPIGTALEPENCVIQTLVRMGEFCQKLIYRP